MFICMQKMILWRFVLKSNVEWKYDFDLILRLRARAINDYDWRYGVRMAAKVTQNQQAHPKKQQRRFHFRLWISNYFPYEFSVWARYLFRMYRYFVCSNWKWTSVLERNDFSSSSVMRKTLMSTTFAIIRIKTKPKNSNGKKQREYRDHKWKFTV